MNPADRLKIQNSINELIKIENLDDVFEEVIRRELSFADMIERLKVGNKNDEAKKIRFFKHMQTRGPTAFDELVQSLLATGNSNLAILLNPSVFDVRRRDSLENIGKSEPILQGNSGLDAEDITDTQSGDVRCHPGCSSLTEVEIDESKLPIKIEVKNAVFYNNGNLDRVYEMMTNPRGFALIINIIEFEGQYEIHTKKKRLGAEHDSSNLKILLKALGYQVTVRTNVYKDNLLRRNGILDNFIAQFNNKTVDSCVVCIMSHGDEDFWIEMTDAPNDADYTANKIHLWNDVISKFSNRNFPSFQGKPKLFVIQACRGLKQNIGIRVQDLERRTQADSSSYQLQSAVRRTMPEFNHIMTLNSTIPGFESIRDKYRGSWFIECVCKIFMNHAWNMSFAEMSSLVAEELERLESLSGAKQSSEFTTVGTVYKLYFNPGLSVDVEMETQYSQLSIGTNNTEPEIETQNEFVNINTEF